MKKAPICYGKDWYLINIEEPVRDIVMALRNNGVNTTCSCGHEMYIECEYYEDEELQNIYCALIELGFDKYRVEIMDDVNDGNRHTYLTIMLPDKNGNYVYRSKDNKKFIKNEISEST
jgi:hypothetical protein